MGRRHSPISKGKRASTRTAAGLSQHFFTGAKEPLVVRRGQTLFASVYLDPENPPAGNHDAME